MLECATPSDVQNRTLTEFVTTHQVKSLVEKMKEKVMKKLDININKAEIKSFGVYLEGDTPRVTATISLIAGTKEITTFSIDSESWNEENKFEVPIKMIDPILAIAKELETIVVLHVNKALKQLEAPKC